MNLRSGTDNVSGIAGFAKAAELLYEHYEDDVRRLHQCKRYFMDGVRRIEGVKINGLLPDAPDGAGTAPHIVSVSVSGVRSEVLLHALEEKGIYVSSGSACSSNHPQVSGVLKGIGARQEFLDATLRFSMSEFTTGEEIDYTLETLKELVPALRKYTRR